MPDSKEPRWKKVARLIIPLPQRSILSIMISLGMVFTYGMRICLSITIIAIVEPKHKSVKNYSNECPFDGYDTGSIKSDPIYTWDEQLIGNILSSFYIGYLITHVPGGLLADIWGGKHVLNACCLLSSIFTILTPVTIIYGGPYYLIAMRILIGAAQGTLFPAINVLLAAWIPKSERSFYGAMVYGATQIGTVIGTAVSGVILNHYHSWTIVYYIFGGIGVIWVIVFCLICSSNPQDHSYISEKEKAMLSETIGVIHRTTRFRDAPWSQILTNLPLLALILAQCGHGFGFFVMVTDLPKYLSDVLHYNIKANGLLSALPFIVMYVVSLLSGYLADAIIKNDLMSLVNCRKLFSAIASFLPAVGLILASYAACDRKLVIIAFTIAMGTMGFFYSSLRVNGLDLSPRFAGTVMALVNGIGSIMGIVAPIIVGLVTPNTTVMEYRIVFWIMFLLLNGTCVIYLFFASGDIQPFNSGAEKPPI